MKRHVRGRTDTRRPVRYRRKKKKRISLNGIVLILPIIVAVVIAYIMLNNSPVRKEPVDMAKGISNVLSVKKNGQLINTLTDYRIEDYGEGSNYSTYITNLIDEYNSSNPGSGISLKSQSKEKDKITVVVEFPNYEDFSGLNGYPLFYGLLSEAGDAGYDMGTMLKSTGKKEEVIEASQIPNPEKRHVLICNVIAGESLAVETFSNIKYLDNAFLTDKKTAVPTEDSVSFIVW